MTFHEVPRGCAPAGCAGFQPLASLYEAAGGAVTGVLYGGASEQAASVAAPLSAHRSSFGFMTVHPRPMTPVTPDLGLPVQDLIAGGLLARGCPVLTNPGVWR